jgi:hypothetical protein
VLYICTVRNKQTFKKTIMNYLDFVVTIVKSEIKLSKDQMQFAYLMFYKTFNETPIQAAKSVLRLDNL